MAKKPAIKKPEVKKEKCLTCPNKAHSRGLCERCLASARSAIVRREVTEEKLIEKKLMLPRKRLGRPATSGFAAAMAKKLGTAK